MMNTVKFYYAFNSPYAFLANTRIEEALADCNCALECRPIYRPRVPGEPLPVSDEKIEYFFEDFARFAQAYGIEPNPGPMADTRKACTGFFHALSKGVGPEFRRAVFAARWLEGRDIGDADTLAEIAVGCGLDAGDFLASLEEESAASKRLDESNAQADAEGIFGVPFFVIGKERFWGNDRIEWVVEHLRSLR